MTSKSRESIPEMPPEIYSENALSEPLKAYNSIQKLLEEVKEKLNKEIDKDLKIKDKKPKQFEFYEEKSVVDFIVNGLSSIKIAESRQNLAEPSPFFGIIKKM